MNKNLHTFILILGLTLFGGFLRFYDNTKNPPSLNIDEVSYGYSAYSVLKTGRDENGVFMPIVFQSIGDYKNPVLTYSLVPLIAIFGLNEFSVRFTTALVGMLSIPLIYLLIFSILKSKKKAIIGSLLLVISPWHIYYSRFASDSLFGLFILMLGMLFFCKNDREKSMVCYFSRNVSIIDVHLSFRKTICPYIFVYLFYFKL